MRQYTPSQLEKQFQALPQILKDAMSSAEVAKEIYESGVRVGLTLRQIEGVAEETGYFILGLTQPNELIKNYADRAGIKEDMARAMAGELKNKVFTPLREALKVAHHEEVGDIVTAASIPAAPSSPLPSQAPPISAPPPPATPQPRPMPPPPPPVTPRPATPQPQRPNPADLREQLARAMATEPTPIPPPSQPAPLQTPPPAPPPQPAPQIPPQAPLPPSPPPPISPQPSAPAAPRFAPNPLPPETPPSKIPPIDLRQGMVPPQQSAPQPHLRPKPPVPPRMQGTDPYREPAQ